MPRRMLLAVALVATPCAAAPLAFASGAAAATATAATADTVPGGGTDGTDGTDGTIADNPFLPDERDLGECSSSLPKPGCGSKAQGGWHQGIVFGVLMLGMAFIGWRIFRAVRRADRQTPDVPV